MDLLDYYMKNKNPVVSAQDALCKVKKLLENIKFPMPSVPKELVDNLYEFSPAIFTTLSDTKELEKSQLKWIEELEKKPVSNFCTLRFNEHGVVSNLFEFWMISEGVALFLSLPYGGLSQDIIEYHQLIGKSTISLAHSICNYIAQDSQIVKNGKKLIIAENRRYSLNNGWGWIISGKKVEWHPSETPSADFLIEHIKR